jgi:hypothetical protein
MMQHFQRYATEQLQQQPCLGVRRRPVRRSAAALAACGAALMLAACSSPASETSDGSSPAQSSAESAGSGDSAEAARAEQPTGSQAGSDQGNPAEAKDAGDSTSAKSTPKSTPKCTAADLKTTVAQGDSSAGHLHFTITFTNAGDQACKLSGHPGVSAVGDDDGTQIGDSATRKGKVGRAAVLIPNAHATADIQAVNIGEDGGPIGESCQPSPADGWRIYPPGSKASVFVEQDGLRACANKDVDWLSVSVVEPVSG